MRRVDSRIDRLEKDSGSNAFNPTLFNFVVATAFSLRSTPSRCEGVDLKEKPCSNP